MYLCMASKQLDTLPKISLSPIVLYFILVSDYIIHPARSFSVTSALGRKINTRRPRPPCYERALINAICKVKYAPNLEHLLPTNQRCQRSTSKQWLLEKKGLHEVRIFNYISVVFWKIIFLQIIDKK